MIVPRFSEGHVRLANVSLCTSGWMFSEVHDEIKQPRENSPKTFATRLHKPIMEAICTASTICFSVQSRFLAVQSRAFEVHTFLSLRRRHSRTGFTSACGFCLFGVLTECTSDLY